MEITKEMVMKEVKELGELIEKQNEEIKQYGTTSEDTAKKITEQESKLAEIEELKAKAAEYENRIVELEARSKRIGLDREMVKSLGSQFVESAEFKEMKKMGSYNSAPFRIKSFMDYEEKALSTTITGGSFYETIRVPEIITPPPRALRVRDLLTVQTTTAGAIEYVEETAFTNAAAAVKEVQDEANESTYPEKPKSTLTFALKTESVKTIAHWIPVTRQVLEDVSQLQSYIDTRMVYGIKSVEEVQILYGAGGTDLSGIMTNSGIQTYKWSDGEVGDTKIDAIRRALTLAELSEYPANGLIVHPVDWESIELAKDSQNRYLWITVTEGGIKRIFALPVVVTTAIEEGEALLGSFNLGATLWDRQEAQIRISEHHKDFFTKNLVAILGEERLALTVFRPKAFVAITFDNAPVGS